MTVTNRIEIDSAGLLGVCRKYDVAALAVFGSALREDFRHDSDIDLLVEFNRKLASDC